MEKFKEDCKNWLGGKPCQKQKEDSTNNCAECVHYSPLLGNSLIMEAGGLGSVLRTSAVSKEMKSQQPEMQVQWLTRKEDVELLDNVTSVDNIITAEESSSLFILQAQEFDKIINFESSPLYLALAKILKSKEKAGFEMNKYGKLITSSEQSKEFLRLQTDDYFRKRLNDKSMQQILLEVAGFEWKEQNYDLITKKHDDAWAQQFLYEKIGISDKDNPKIIGLNIGSSRRHDAKRWPVENFFTLAQEFQRNYPDWKLAILAGPEEKDLYKKLEKMQSEMSLKNIIFTGYKNSISQFISLMNNIPIIVSADTFGMHAAIGLGKNVVSLHGPQPQQEVYLYGKGTKVHLNMECAPCFASKIDKCVNSQRLQCMRSIDVQTVKAALENEIRYFD